MKRKYIHIWCRCVIRATKLHLSVSRNAFFAVRIYLSKRTQSWQKPLSVRISSLPWVSSNPLWTFPWGQWQISLLLLMCCGKEGGCCWPCVVTTVTPGAEWRACYSNTLLSVGLCFFRCCLLFPLTTKRIMGGLWKILMVLSLWCN